MRNISLFFSACVAAFMISCEGPAGPPGFDGLDGLDGQDGINILGSVFEIEGSFTFENDYTLFYDAIAGFEFEPGYEYELLVQVDPVENPPADASNLQYTLIEEVSKNPVSADTHTDTETYLTLRVHFTEVE